MGLELPENAKDMQTHGLAVRNNLLWYSQDGYASNEKLPQGDWQLLGWSDEITEEQAVKVVDNLLSKESCGESIWFPDYTVDKVNIGKIEMWSTVFKTAHESLASLLASKGITKRLYLIYKLK